MAGMYRLIWLQHVHKSAGSTIVNQAIANGEVPYGNHKNGNPYTDEGELLHLWDFNDEQLGNFVDKCEEEGVTFVATEWGAPNYETLERDPRVILITCLREPYSRLVSNFNYDYYFGFSKSTTIEEYISEAGTLKMDNFLVRVYSRKYQNNSDELDDKSLEIALTNLRRFDLVLAIENQNDLSEHLFEALGWKKKQVDSHRTFGNFRILLSLVVRLRFFKAWNYFARSIIGDTEFTKSRFIQHSRLDTEFYNRILQESIRGNLHPLQKF